MKYLKFILIIFVIGGIVFGLRNYIKTKIIATSNLIIGIDNSQHVQDNSLSNEEYKNALGRIDDSLFNIRDINNQAIIKQKEINNIVKKSNKILKNIDKLETVEQVLKQNELDWDKI